MQGREMQPSRCGGVLKCRDMAGQDGSDTLGARAAQPGSEARQI